MKVENLTSSKGNTVPNQFQILTNGATYFQSYSSMIAKVTSQGIILTDKWNYSKTTSKYLYSFLGMNRKEIEKGLKDGTIKLDNSISDEV
jgi:hypothetical protein